ncbi:hypothetical protein [Bacillus pseudomycoides]|uniref:hypothetical protein n=1 Tax=Bacillus pseudomycoides TaxID=64104 RepID=UPI000504C17F|nr:hypothetical protein [Bacillus pseudomycoides]KFN13749.1 putative membrane protein [Bacillus pseudomycoides]MDR4188110.1 hypothetical protein [Bacillus pseudomycoides]MED0856357.1 hypothetical protein [Bacillus pseudomycoides]PEK70419.1 hypothetical protein CN593_05215 [Bacillus pseudomycoides]PEN08598.1 hypothetical protein CN640_13245 [Bacillus pseudomycoides]
MEKKDLTILKEQLNEAYMSILIAGLASFVTIILGNLLKIDFPGWFTILVDYVIPWMYALIMIPLLIRFIKVIGNIMKNL